MRHVLIVDDDRAMAVALRMALEQSFGPTSASTSRVAIILRIDLAHDLETALRLVRDRPRDEPYALLLSDVSMHSFEELAFLSHAARYRFPDLHVLLVSACDENELATLAPQVEAHAWLTVSLDRLVQTVRPWLVPDRGPPRRDA